MSILYKIIYNYIIQLDIIYFDIKKAFDSVLHSTLFSKLKNFGISGQCFNFVSAYLYNRVYSVF